MTQPDAHGRSTMVFDPVLTTYDFGPDHPMSPVRIDLTMRLAEELGVIDGLTTLPAPVASLDRLETVHSPALIEAVERMGHNPGPGEEAFGLGTPDNPVFLGMHEAAARVVGATCTAVEEVWSGRSLHSANITGGLHHGMRDRASGFCVYNDLAVAITWLLDAGAQRVAYVDVDVHHGDGVESAFYDDPRVLTVSLHESGRYLFPGTGSASDIGGPDARGTAVNVALPPYTSDAGWLRAFDAVVPEVLRAFQPEILITQHGCDGHRDDPLAHLDLTVDGQRLTYLMLHDLAHELTGGKWVATGGGGYALTSVVPRAWSHLLAIVAGSPLEPDAATPQEWRNHVAERFGGIPPFLMGDGRVPTFRDWRHGIHPDTALDRAILDTRRAVFPEHGLDPDW